MNDTNKSPATAAPGCPQCGGTDNVPIVYGYPGGDTFAAAERGELMLGGCILWGDDPQWKCRACGHRWCATRG